MTDSGTGATADTMRGRVGESRVRLWVLMEANRLAVTAGLAVVVFVSLVVIGAVAPVSLRTVATQSDPVETLFQALVTTIVTGVTLVVTISQLILSQELGSVGDQRERMEGAMDFREDSEAFIEPPVSPSEPSAFLRELVAATARRADELADAVESGHDRQVRERVTTFADELRDNATEVRDQLDGAEFGTFGVVSAALDYNYSAKINDGRRLQAEHGGDLSDEANETLAALVDTLALFGPAREHVKTLYFQWELVDLSRVILYSALPALVVAVGMLLFGRPELVAGTTAGVDSYLLVVCAAVTIALLPFVILLAYILRVVTVTKRTLAIGPFVLRDTGE